VDHLGEIGASEADAIEHLGSFAQGQLGMAAVGEADPSHGETGDAQHRWLITRALQGHQVGQE